MEPFTKLNPPERSRTYVFANNERLTYRFVHAICVRPSGTHRLEIGSPDTGNELKVIVPSGWLAIEIDTDAWTL